MPGLIFHIILSKTKWWQATQAPFWFFTLYFPDYKHSRQQGDPQIKEVSRPTLHTLSLYFRMTLQRWCQQSWCSCPWCPLRTQGSSKTSGTPPCQLLSSEACDSLDHLCQECQWQCGSHLKWAGKDLHMGSTSVDTPWLAHMVTTLCSVHNQTGQSIQFCIIHYWTALDNIMDMT